MVVKRQEGMSKEAFVSQSLLIYKYPLKQPVEIFSPAPSLLLMHLAPDLGVDMQTQPSGACSVASAGTSKQ